MSVAQLQQGTEAAWKYTYRCSSIARRLWRTAAPLPLALVTNLGYRYYAHNLHRFYTCDAPVEPSDVVRRRVEGWLNPAETDETRQPVELGGGIASTRVL
jgi:hypothetical protein